MSPDGGISKIDIRSMSFKASCMASAEVSDSTALEREYLCDRFGMLKLGTQDIGLLPVSHTLSLD